MFVCGMVEKIVIEDGCVIGIQIVCGGKFEVICVNVEVIIVVSLINLFKLLMLLGIGFVVYLVEYGIDVVVDCLGVG